jgi:hypothetical protein
MYRIRVFLWPLIVLYPLSVRLNFVVFPQEPLLKLGVPWVKKKLRNTVLDEHDKVAVRESHTVETTCNQAREIIC